MKRLYFMSILCACSSALFGQETRIPKDTVYHKNNDTIRIGSILIIKKNKKGDHDTASLTINTGSYKTHSRVSTNYGILDLGFSNWDDQTDYATAGNYLVNRPGSPSLSSSDLKVRANKSINVNIWFFMQRLNLVKHYVNLKYGLGLELNNYRYKSHISYLQSNPFVPGQEAYPVIFRDSILFSKNKLAADYITIPFMLNFSSNPAYENRGLSLSVGISTGYLYNSRNKQISDERGKLKNEGDYDLKSFKFAYIAELGIGPVRLYGSYSPSSMYEGGLNMRPYAVGIRFSNW